MLRETDGSYAAILICGCESVVERVEEWCLCFCVVCKEAKVESYRRSFRIATRKDQAMGLSGCYALLKYLVLLVNLIFWVSSIFACVFSRLNMVLVCSRNNRL